MVKEVGAQVGPALAQVVKRALVWWVNPRSDLRKGDTVEVVYEIRSGEEPTVHALWFHSQKLGRAFEVVRYKPDAERFPRWYQPDGTELELRLVGGPIGDYEQVTSLLRDGRRHKGVDFKAPVGTPILAPFSGKVVRKNWSRRGNGNCLDIERSNGQRIYLLHLDRIKPGIAVGSRVKAGQQVAWSGNTGRSTAPHLHYQIQQGHRGRILDPFRIHETKRVGLEPAALGPMKARLQKLGTLRTRSP